MKFTLILILLHFYAVIFSQNNQSVKSDSIKYILKLKQTKIDSLKKINFIDKKYKYLDKDFRIKIENEKLVLNKLKNAKNYKDSLMIVLQIELNDNDAVNIAFHSILFNWEKLSYYIWEDSESAKKICNEFGYDHPYKFYKFLTDLNTKSNKKNIFLKNLKSKLFSNLNESIDIYPYDNFLNYAFKHNPNRIKKMNEYLNNYNSKIKN